MKQHYQLDVRPRLELKQRYRLRLEPSLPWRTGPIHIYSIRNHGTIGAGDDPPAQR